MLKTINTKKSGFTLVEMLVSIAVFMVVMTVAVGSLVSIIDANRKAQAIKNVVNNINFALESISKDMRMGTDYSCYLNSSYVGDCSDLGIGVKYKSPKGNYVHYRFVKNPSDGQGNVQRCVEGASVNCPTSGWESLTAPTENINITNMNFYVFGSSKTDSLQPKVLITLEGVAGTKDTIKTVFNLQTTVTQRAREPQE
jgi:type II secretory pathway pseudopilin PulG